MPVLRLGVFDPVTFTFRPLTGDVEHAVEGGDTQASALQLARHITCLGDGRDHATLPVCLLHRLYLEMFRWLYDGPFENVSRCGACDDAFEFQLDLDDIVRAQDADASDKPPLVDGWFDLGEGRFVRAPTPGDLAVPSAQHLLGQITKGNPDQRQVDAFLETAAPVLDFDIETSCPHCGKSHALRFNIARYLVQKVRSERGFLLREVHLIATQYQWSRNDIMGLSREDRRTFANLIQSERQHRRGLRAVS